MTIDTFAKRLRWGPRVRWPRTTEEAQYSLPFPVAAALVYGDIGGDEVSAPKLADPRVTGCSKR